MKRSSRSSLPALIALSLTFALAACGSDSEQSGGGGSSTPAAQKPSSDMVIKRDPMAASAGTITVGAKNFLEQVILGEIYSQTLEAAGYKVKTRPNIGSEQVTYKALKSGQIDAYPEYTGTALTSFFDVKTDDVPDNPDQAYQLAKAEFAKENITALPRTPFENKYVLASTKETAQKNGNPKTISQLMQKNPNLSLSGFPECRQRQDCLLGIRDVYGFKGKFVSSEGKFNDLDNGQADLALVFSTDPQLALGKYQVYEDDKGFYPPYNITFNVRDETMRKIGPQTIAAIERVQKGLTNEAMSELNRRGDLEKQEEEDVAAAYLKESGFVK